MQVVPEDDDLSTENKLGRPSTVHAKLGVITEGVIPPSGHLIGHKGFVVVKHDIGSTSVCTAFIVRFDDCE